MLTEYDVALLDKNRPHICTKKDKVIYFRLTSGWSMWHPDGTIYLSQIEYCPWCGEKLGEQAKEAT